MNFNRAADATTTAPSSVASVSPRSSSDAAPAPVFFRLLYFPRGFDGCSERFFRLGFGAPVHTPAGSRFALALVLLACLLHGKHKNVSCLLPNSSAADIYGIHN